MHTLNSLPIDRRLPGMKIHRRVILAALICSCVLEACGSPSAAVPSGAIEPTATIRVTTNLPAPTETAASPTAALTSTPQPSPTNTALAPGAAPCNAAKFVADITIPDDWETSPGTAFTKTWRLKNVGACAWTSGYAVVYDHGDNRMDAPETAPLTAAAVPPGETVDASVNLKAPSVAGSYQAFFKLRAPDGATFGIGSAADTAFWVKIKVTTAEEPSGNAPDLQVASDTGTITAKNTGIVYASCPAGTVVTGGGFSASNNILVSGQSKMLDSWQIWAVNTGSVDGTLTAYAVCMATTRASSELTLRLGTPAGPGRASATAPCPAGSVLTNGGYYIGGDGIAWIVRNGPAGTAWTTLARRDDGKTPLLSVYAMCLSNAPAVSSSVSSSTEIAPGEKGFAEIACPEGKGITGGGWQAGADLLVVTAAPLDGAWRVYAKNTGSQTQTLEAQAVCLTLT
jgi:hypothetical protein